MNKYLILIFLSIFCLGGLFFYQNAKFNDGKLHIIVCNVGQGDAIFIRTPGGNDVLVDGGPDDSVLTCLSNHMPFWDRSIEVMIATHPHSDHITGLISVLKRYRVMHYFTENVKTGTISYKRLQDALAMKNLTAKNIFSGDSINFSDKTSILTLWPEEKWFENQRLQDINNISSDSVSLDNNGFSVIEVVSYKDFKVLLTGDAGSMTEDKIAKYAGKVDVLKVPHHGSKTGMSDYFLSEVQPSLAIISVGAKNKYGHPSKEALNFLSKYGIKTLRTDKNGEVEIVTDGKTFSY